MYLVGMVVSISQAVGADGDALPEHALANAGPMVNTAHLIKKFLTDPPAAEPSLRHAIIAALPDAHEPMAFDE